MTQTELTYSPDQAEAHDRIAAALRGVGVDIDTVMLTPPREGKRVVLAVTGKAGSGKTLLLAALYRALEEAGVEIVSGDYESRKRRDKRTLAILAPTNKAASVLRMRGVPATTIHRILYTPVYHPEYEKIAEWLAGQGERPEIEGLTDLALDRASPFPARSRRLACAGRISSPAGSAVKSRWILALSMKQACLTHSSSKTCKRFSRPFCSLAIRHNCRLSNLRAGWCLKPCPLLRGWS